MYFCKRIFALAICIAVAKQNNCIKTGQRIANRLVYLDGPFGKLQCIKECLLRKRCEIMGYNKKYLRCEHGEDQETVLDGDDQSTTASRSEILKYQNYFVYFCRGHCSWLFHELAAIPTYVYKDILGQCANHNCSTGQRCIKYRSTHLCVKDWCSESWVFYRNHCYYFSTQSVTLDAAKNECIAMNSSIVKVEDIIENYWIRSHIPDTIDIVWLGATDVVEEGKWIWEVDSSPLLFSQWRESSPDNYANDEHCLVMVLNGQWGDIPCWKAYRFICKKNLNV